MAKRKPLPYVENGKLYTPSGDVILRLPTAPRQRTGWWDWLDDPVARSFNYISPDGARCNVYKQKRVGRTGKVHYYWWAERRLGKLSKIYLGKSSKLTVKRLNEVARKLSQRRLPEHTTPVAVVPDEKMEQGTFDW